MANAPDSGVPMIASQARKMYALPSSQMKDSRESPAPKRYPPSGPL